MGKSLFIEYVSRVWPKLNLYVKEKVNGQKKPLKYYHKEMLTPVFSADQKWEGTSANTTYVAADMVAMDSPLPLKSRDSVAQTGGKLPKIGMKKQLKETQINAINIMKAHLSMTSDEGAKKSQLGRIFNKITDDGYACSVGIDERNELNFLKGLSEGIILVPDEENTGTGMRVNYGYMPEHCFGVAVADTLTGDDIERVLAKADIDGNTLSVVAIALSTYNKIRKSQWAKELVANYKEQVVADSSRLPVPTAVNFDEAFKSEYGLEFLKIDRTVIVEKNGKKISIKPFNPAKLVFLPQADNVGSLVWGTLAEDTNRVAGVEYSTVDDYKLISRYSKTDPLQEITNGQALCLPVIEDADLIYSIDLSDAQVVDETKEGEDSTDEKITIWGKTYKKPEFVQALNKIAGSKLSAKSADEKVIAKANELSDADEEALKTAVETHIAS